MSFILIEDIFFVFLLSLLAVPIGSYIYKIMNNQKVFLTKVFSPVERLIYNVLGESAKEEMNAKKYSLSILIFSLIGLLFLILIQMIQSVLPLNPEQIKGVNFSLAFNTAASFVSNTNWQAYSGQDTLSYLTQMLGLTTQNFVSASTGIAVLFALIRGFILKNKNTIGNFWVDLTKVTLYILIPLSLVVSIAIASQGVVQTFSSYKQVTTLEGQNTETVPLGPAASQIAIKQLGTNGGGFFGANSSYPLENPNSFSNFVQVFSIIIIPAALCFTFGKAVKSQKQGIAVYVAMLILLIISISVITLCEKYQGPAYNGVVASGNMEGKEVLNGIGDSSLWGAVTTAVSNGSVNSMHDSFTPISGMILMFQMQLGEIIFGGVGSGLYGMIAFILLTVFIAGLMVGRTPEFLEKKIEPYDMKMVCLVIITPPLLTLLSTAWAVMMPQVNSWFTTNIGAHRFSEVLYSFTSMANNNGSAFAGFNGNTVFTNVLGGIVMLLVRFIPIVAVLYLAQNLASKKSVATSEGTLSTSNSLFIGLLLFIILIIGALSFLPALSLGPLADFFTSLK